MDKAGRSDKLDKAEKPGKLDKAGKSDKMDKTDKMNKTDKTDKIDKLDNADKTDKKNIGTLARFMGVSSHTIKYYEKIGLLTSERDEHSNYRQYVTQSCIPLIDCMKYRNMGFSLKEMDFLTKEADSAAHMEMLKKRTAEVKEEIRKLEELYGILREYEEQCQNAEERQDEWYIEPFDRVIYCRLQTKNLDFENHMGDDEINLMDFSPRTASLAVLSREYLTGGPQKYSWGMCVSFPERQPAFEGRPEFICLAPRKAFIVHRKYTGHFLSNGEMAEDICRLFHEYSPIIPSDAYALGTKIVHDKEGRDWNYFEIIIPL